MPLKVAALSNRNKFGLRTHIFIGPNGTGWRALANSVNELKEGDVVDLDEENPDFVSKGFAYPMRLSAGASETLRKVFWGQAPVPATVVRSSRPATSRRLPRTTNG